MEEVTLDLTEFKERVQDDVELLLELLDIFVEDFRLKRALMDEAVANKNSDDLRSLVHSLKGASGNISAKAMRLTLANLEEISKNNQLSELDDTFSLLDNQFAELIVRIEDIKKRLGA